MNHMNIRRGISVQAKPGESLTDAQMRAIVPSIFAAEPHDSRSARYAYIPTSEIVTAMRAEGFLPVRAVQRRSRDDSKFDFTKHMIRFRHAGDITTRERRVGDTYPEVVLVNSHDGSSAYHLEAGAFRLVCLNGMVVQDKDFAGVKVGHMGDIRSKVLEGSYEVLNESRKALHVAGAWTGIELDRGQRQAFAEAARVIRLGDADGTVDSPIAADAFLVPRRRADADANLWTTFNVVQENAIKGGLTARTPGSRDQPSRTVTTRAVNGIDSDLRMNRALWHIAQALATGLGHPATAAA